PVGLPIAQTHLFLEPDGSVQAWIVAASTLGPQSPLPMLALRETFDGGAATKTACNLPFELRQPSQVLPARDALLFVAPAASDGGLACDDGGPPPRTQWVPEARPLIASTLDALIDGTPRTLAALVSDDGGLRVWAADFLADGGLT